MKIVSLLPSATAIVCALGRADSLVWVTHECDYPPEVKGKPVLTASRMPGANLTSAEIYHAVSTRLGGHESLYTLDEERLRAHFTRRGGTDEDRPRAWRPHMKRLVWSGELPLSARSAPTGSQGCDALSVTPEL
jgi:hypothetical protein